MTGLAPEDLLILGVALVIVLNRVFASPPLRSNRPAYVATQSVNFAVVITLFFFRLEGYPPKLDQAVRVFLMFFVAYHMVLANQMRARALRKRVEERRDHERRAEEKARRLEELAAFDAANFGAEDEAP